MARLVVDTLTYERCGERWESASARQRNAGAVRLAPNTVLVRYRDRHEGAFVYAVRFYSTYILEFREWGAVAYNHGGSNTRTTVERMNRYGPGKVYSKQYQLRISWNVEGEVRDEPLPLRFTIYPYRKPDLKEYPDAQAFEVAIWSSQIGDTVALGAYADWLDEHGFYTYAAHLRPKPAG